MERRRQSREIDLVGGAEIEGRGFLGMHLSTQHPWEPTAEEQPAGGEHRRGKKEGSSEQSRNQREEEVRVMRKKRKGRRGRKVSQPESQHFCCFYTQIHM